MQEKEKLRMQMESDRSWAKMRDHQVALLGILTMRKPTELDILWSMGCIGLIYSDLVLYKNDIGEEDIKKELDNFNKGSQSKFENFSDDLQALSKIFNEDVSMDDKQNILERMRKKLWIGIVNEESRLNYLVNNFGNIRDEMDIMFIYKCVALVCFELKIKDIEIKILEGEL